MTSSSPRRALSVVAVVALALALLGVRPVAAAPGETIRLGVDQTAKPEGDTDGPATTFTFTIFLDPVMQGLPTVGGEVDWVLTDGTATASEDYAGPEGETSGTVTFAPTDRQKTVVVTVVGDDDPEPNETFTFAISGGTGETCDGTCSQTVTIQNDEPNAAPSLAIVPADSSGLESATPATFTVVRSGAASSKTITVQYRTRTTDPRGSATAGQDYTSTPEPGTLTFEPGDTEHEITVPITNDATDEADEDFFVDLFGTRNATIAVATAHYTIIDDDGPPALTINDPQQNEGNSGTSTMTFTVSLSAASGQTVTVNYATAPGTAISTATADKPADFTAASNTLTFAPGDTEKSVPVSIVGDTTHETNETFTVNLTGATNAGIADAQGTGTILNDDAAPTLSVGDVGNVGEAAGNATFTITRTGATEVDVTGTAATADGAARAGSDYTAVSKAFTIAAGGATGTATVDVPITDDAADEPNEAFQLSLTDVTGATVTKASATATIVDNDDPPTVSVTADPTSVSEGSATTFTVELAEASGRTVTVSYKTQGVGTHPAEAGTDFQAREGTLTFNPGVTTQTVTVNVFNDPFDEENETFELRATGATNATLSETPAATVTILDANAPPTLSIADLAKAEGSGGGSTNFDFTVTLSAPSQRTITVKYSTAAGDAPAAETPSDYTAVTDSTITFAPGVTSQPARVVVVADDAPESNETFKVVLSAPANATLSRGTAIGTIVNDDGGPATITVSDASVVEGGQLVFTITRTGDSSQASVVTYEIEPGTATAGDDYTAPATQPQTITFAIGETQKQVTVPTAQDTLDEDDETLTLELLEATNAALTSDTTGVGTITDDDDPPVVSITGPTSADEDAGELTYTVVLDAPSGREVRVNISVDDITTLVDSDYEATATTLVFEAGETEKPFTVTVIDDETREGDESYEVVLSGAVNASIDPDASSVETTIVDNDPVPVASVASPAAVGENAGKVTFTVTLDRPRSTEVTVSVATAEGTATPGSDYTELSTTVTFMPGETSKPVDVALVDDAVNEATETFLFRITDATGAEVSGTAAEATGTINDDDPPPTLTIGNVTVAEGNSGTVNAVLTVTKTGSIDRDVTVSWATANGSASAPADYAAAAGTLTFAPDEVTKTITIVVNGDTLNEANETFTVVLSSPTNATIAQGTGTVTITDDDQLPALSINDVTVTEGNSGTVNAAFTVTLTPASGRAVSVAYATSNGSATAGSDYNATSGTLTFAAGETSKTITVAVRGDVVDEANETFNVTLSNATNATISDATGVGTIIDDDEPAKPQAQQRYVLVGGDGKVYAFNTTHRGDMAGQKLNQPIIGLTMTPTGNGYWLVAKDGGIFTFGDAQFFGSMGDQKLNQPVLGMEATPTGKGYWLFAADGGIFTFGDAKFHGSTGNMTLNAPVIGMETTGDGSGYWLVAQDGGIFTFNAPFHGSTGDMKLNQPVFDMAALADGSGYWLVARDGGIFTFGEAGFEGSAVGQTTSTVIGMRDTPSGEGYWIADATGKVMVFGDADYLGDVRTTVMTPPIVGFAAVES